MTMVREIDHIEALADYRAAWTALLAETPGASFFQSLDWLEVYWRHFAAGQRLRTLIACDGDRPVGIVPLAVRREASRVGRLRVLTYPLADWGSYYGPVGPDPTATLTLGLTHLRHTPRDWDLLELRWLGAPGTEPQHAARAMHAAGWQAYLTSWQQTSVVDLAGDWEVYLAARPRGWRKNLRYAERKLAEQGTVEYLRWRPGGRAAGDADPRWDLYDACESVARRSWQGGATNGTTLTHVTVRDFFRDAHAAAAALGSVDLNLLLLAGEPVAFVYNYVWQGYVSGMRLGFDPRVPHAGNVLLARSLADSFARGDRCYDLGVGSHEAKRHVMTGSRDILRCSHFPAMALRAQLLRLRRWQESRALRRSAASAS